MKTTNEALISDLLQRTEKAKKAALFFKTLSEPQLNFKKDETSWSILECLEHLNLYGDFYLKTIENQLLKAEKVSPSTSFKSGILGDYFANSMLPKAGKVTNKMKTFKDKNPIHSALPLTTIDRFLKQQDHLISLLNVAKNVNLTKTKTPITLPILRLRLGDTFRFVIFHNERHLLQAENILKK